MLDVSNGTVPKINPQHHKGFLWDSQDKAVLLNMVDYHATHIKASEWRDEVMGHRLLEWNTILSAMTGSTCEVLSNKDFEP